MEVETDRGLTGIGEAHPGKGINDTVVKRLKPLIRDGQFVLLHGPGLGMTFNEEGARAHLKPGYTFSEQGKKAVDRALS